MIGFELKQKFKGKKKRNQPTNKQTHSEMCRNLNENIKHCHNYNHDIKTRQIYQKKIGHWTKPLPL